MALAWGTGLKGVRVYRADQSLFYHYPSLQLKEGEIREEALRQVRQRLRRRLDGTARQLGFKMKKKYAEWLVEDNAAQS